MSTQYGLVAGKDQVPLQSVSVSGQIKGYVAGLDINLCYHNSSDSSLEVLFRFPVEEAMAVVGLEAKIAGKTIKGVVKEKEEARATYDDAIASGLTAALGEEKTGDIFSLALGNLPPRQQAQLHLQLVTELPVEAESGAARFSLPTVLKPRYTPVGSTDPLAGISGGDSDVQTGTGPAISRFSMEVVGADGVSSITSPTHDIDIKEREGSMEVGLKESGPLVKDVVLLVSYKEPNTPRAIVEEGTEGDNELLSNPAVMLDFWPKFDSPQAACEFVFVVDRSGSMRGSYINSAKETLILFLKSIPPGCFFNVIGFGSRFQHLFPRSVSYNQENLDKALQHAKQLDADLGGTQLLEPLGFVFQQNLLPGLPRQVFVLTDGSVSNTQACINETKKNAHSTRVFTFGIGSGASTELVKGLAKAGNGSAEFIKEGERMQSKVISSLKKALQPSVSDIQLTFNVPSGVEVVQSPSKIPPVFNGDKLVMYALMKNGAGKRGECTAVLKGNVMGSSIEHCIKFKLEGSVSATALPVVHQLSAKSLIQDWQNGNGLEGQSSEGRKSAIIKLSIESSVVSSHTAYIAVDEDQDKPIEGAMKVWDLTAVSPREPILFGGGPILLGGGPGGMLMTCSRSAGRGGAIAYNSAGQRSKASPKYFKAAGAMPKLAKKSKTKASASDMRMEEAVERFRCVPDIDASVVQMSMDAGGGSSQAAVVLLQTAEGYWKLDDSLATLVGHSLTDLKSLCPSGCSDSVWATILAMVLLEKKYSQQKDEWELIVMKAEMWLQGQSLPSGVTVASLKEIAAKLFNS